MFILTSSQAKYPVFNLVSSNTPQRSVYWSRSSMVENMLRRSARIALYESNGRDYLANIVGWSRPQLEQWLKSHTVRPHLQLWYRLCISGKRRFNEAIEWINTGKNGYFYNERDLEEDLLLACLGEGDGNDIAEVSGYADVNANTGTWTTQELWARTAWRIVNADVTVREATGNSMGQHASASYAFAIDVLCLAFHSIAFRGKESRYHGLINGHLTARANEHDALEGQANDDVSDAGSTLVSTSSTSSGSADDEKDLDFDVENSQTSGGSHRPVKVSALQRDGQDAATSNSNKVKEWVASVQKPELEEEKLGPDKLYLIDEDGEPITGYSVARSVFAMLEKDARNAMSIEPSMRDPKMLAWKAMKSKEGPTRWSSYRWPLKA